MFQQNQNEQITKIGNWIAERVNKYEKILALTALAGVLLKVSKIGAGNFLLVVSLLALVVMYFGSAFALTEAEKDQPKPFIVFARKLVFWGLSVLVNGILFKLENYPGAMIILQQGFAIMIFILIIGFYERFKKTELTLMSRRVWIRFGVLSVICILLFFTPKETMKRYNLISETNIEGKTK